MSIRLEMSFDTVEEMLAVFQGKILPTSAAAMEVAPAPVKAEAPKAPKQPKAEKPAATQPASETVTPAPAPEPAASAPAAASHSEPAEPAPATPAPAVNDYAPVGAAITRLVNDGQRDKVLEALAKFGAKKGPELKPEQYADFMQEISK